MKADLAAFVVDSSTVLAFVHEEPGSDQAAWFLARATISPVNWAEVAEKVLARGDDIETVRSKLRRMGLMIDLFVTADAEAAARLRALTRAAGLSLGDRACLALARLYGLPAVTADRAWKRVEVGVDVRILR